MIAGVVLTAPVWRGASTGRVWRALVLITGLSWVVIGCFPEDQSLTVHSTGALPVFVLGNLALVLASRSGATRGLRSVRRLSLVLGVLGLVGLGLTAVAIARPHGAVGVGAAERLTVFPLQIWTVLLGLHLLRPPRWAGSTATRDRSTRPVTDQPYGSSSLS